MTASAEQLDLLAERLGDPMWRLCSGALYHIAPADGQGIIPFIPSPDQRKIFAAYFGGCKQLALLKCRRPGFSTALGVLVLDQMIFKGGIQASLVDQNQGDASKKMDRIVGVAFDNLPVFIKSRVLVHARNGKQFSLQFAHKARSDFYAGMNARGGSNDFLWISEWGVIQFEDPKRSATMRSGGLPSARHGCKVIETTWAGGRNGDLYEVLEPVLTGAATDWEIQFSPWQHDVRNVSETAEMDDVARKYFAGMKERGMEFTEAQMRWWAAEKRQQGVFMFRENPTVLEEMWLSPVKGAIYAAEIERARGEGRIGRMPVDGNSLVHTCSDLGGPMQWVTWYFQIVGRFIRVVDVDLNLNLTLIQRIAHMKGKGYAFGNHFMPHDAMQTSRSGRTLADEFAAAWLKVDLETLTPADLIRSNLKFVPRTHDVWVGINHGLQLFSSLEFRSECDLGLEHLGLYRTSTEDKNAGVLVHDRFSHAADALRTLFEAHLAGMVATKAVGTKPEWEYPRLHRGKVRQPMRAARVGG